MSAESEDVLRTLRDFFDGRPIQGTAVTDHRYRRTLPALEETRRGVPASTEKFKTFLARIRTLARLGW
jgi:hypothetical protein